nr:ATP-binding protein [Aneurinibacillus soli]
MNSVQFRTFIIICVLFALSVLILLGAYYPTIPRQDSPHAKQGVLDLSNWKLHSTVPLDGEWEFYEGKLLEPADFHQGTRTDVSYFPVPGVWNGKNQTGGMTKKGYGTYRLRVIVPSYTDDIFGIKLRSIRMSHRLYINGKLDGESGRPTTEHEEHVPGNTPATAFFHTDSREIEIVIQVANYEFATGGIINSIEFGHSWDIAKLNAIQLGSDLATICILGMFGTYHLSLYSLRRKEKAYLYSGLYLLCLVVMQLLYGEKILLRTFPTIPFDLAYKLLDLSEFLSLVVGTLFFSSIIPRLLTTRTKIVILAPIVCYTFAIVVLPYSVYNAVKDLFFLYNEIGYLYMFVRMMYLYRQSERGSSDRKELLLFIGGFISLMIFLIDGILYAGNMVSSDVAGKIGVMCFIICMNILLAQRFTQAYEKTEILSHQLSVTNQLKDEFLKHTSHEIKTPLHGILNMTSYLLDDEERNLSTKQKQNLWLIKDTSMKLSMLIHDLIDVTRLKHGDLRLYPTAVGVKVVVQIIIEMLQFELFGKSVQLENQVGSDVWVLVDENRLRQILYNLVHNAIKHTEAGTIKVTSRISEGHVYLSVEDTGKGIPREKHTKIFEYFEQANQSLPEDGYTGMGVGLYISRKLVEKMGGEIRLEWSEVGQGTRMTFTLPYEEPTPIVRETATSATFIQSRVVYDDLQLDILDQHEHTILIVDDEASNIHTLLNILKRYRYNVVTAISAKEALYKIKQHPNVDLVLLDVMMPETSGIELCQKLRDHYSILDLPILFATVKDTPQDITLGFRAGANDYVTKPFDAETLIARIQTLIAMKTSIQEAIRTEHAFLQAQIKPHFLYNALSSVISFCYTDGEKAAHLLAILSQYLRYILEMDRTQLVVPLYRELELIHVYVEIEKARFGERFDFDWYVDDRVQHLGIPSLCIQPFVENAIRHGLFEKDGHGQVTLSIQQEEHSVRVVIEDDGVGIPADQLYQISTGERQAGSIGIANIRKRLDSIVGATLTISSEMGRGTTVTMHLPLPT